MNSYSISFRSGLIAGSIVAAMLSPVDSLLAQNRSPIEQLKQEHRERRAKIVNGIGEVFSSIFGEPTEYRSRRSVYPDSGPDRIYESRGERRSAPPGWNAPFPPPRDLLTARDRYEIYRNEQRYRYQTAPVQGREAVATNRPSVPALREYRPSVDAEAERPGFFETLPGAAPSRQIPPAALEETSAPRAVLPEPKPLSTGRSVSVPAGSRESRRIGSSATPVTSEARGQIPPAPSFPEIRDQPRDFPDASATAPKNDSPETAGSIGSLAAMSGAETLPLDMEFSTSSGGVVRLGELLEGNRAIIIDFWATWSGEAMSRIDQINTVSAEMQALGISVVGMNFDGNADTVERVRRSQEISVPWLLEPRTRPFSRDLQVETVPHRMLIDTDGVILFSGDPDDDALRQVIDTVVNEGLRATVR